ncbi:pullulanase [Cytobacillus eiseniae]|uniref:Pullulanase n=1 Tax=Cytobacillus eiseniae TaxID=762947 RepID=A0ABS4REX8_9BACI|nr:type I pullulanase [Cytobacillus eiseniae]MBP2241460.1 pullulanase [Cytobacillus eiseniae]
MISNHRKFNAYLDEMEIITILLPNDYYEGTSAFFLIEKENKNDPLPLTILKKIPLQETIKYICQVNEQITLGEQYWIIDAHGGRTDLQIGAVIRTKAFDQAFFYDGSLGVCYREEQSEFKLWAPTATEVKLFVNHEGALQPQFLQMERGEKGLWFLIVPENLEKARYSYHVCVNMEWKEAVDPYATAVSINGEYGIIVDLAKTNRIKPPLPSFEQPTDAIIYETHIRDLTIHPNSGTLSKGTYLGAAELHTVGANGALTGLSYIKELGITHIEFLPFHDFEGVDESEATKKYNWGYNPLHFNAPDGSFSTDPRSPYKRIHELKTMIHAVHTEGLRVLMDVVYNHVYIRESSSFEKIVPGYFFRHDEYGMPANGTGVGNDFASERLMGRKFIIDSIMFWLKEYQVDGFRFDLMGILDIETMNMIREKVDEIDPSILLIGEGWDLNTPIPLNEKASIRNQALLPRIGQFNDWFRDTVKGSTFNLYDKGYALGNVHYYEAAKEVLAGSIGIEKSDNGLFHSPIQSVNYVESHDNHTLWDKLVICMQTEEEEIKQKQHRLATAMVLLAQGIPFLHSGQEFFRTKKGIGNSYRSPDSINQLDWDKKDHYQANVNYIRGLIAIRKSHKAFRLSKQELIRRHMHFLPCEKPIIGYRLKDVAKYGEWDEILVFFNPAQSEGLIQLPAGTWFVLADDETAAIISKEEIKYTLMLPPISIYIAARR